MSHPPGSHVLWIRCGPMPPERVGPRPAETGMNFEKFTERSRGFVQAAQTLAMGQCHQQLTPEHLLKVLLDDQEDLASNRSEEHTSELQSLMRISYAVFCLKKKT